MTRANRIVSGIQLGTALLLCCLFALAQAAFGMSSPPPDYKISYTRQPREATPIPAGQVDPNNGRIYAEVRDPSVYQHWYDVGNPNRFTETDLVGDDLSGRIGVIHNCTTSPEFCAAHDGRWSPDGTKLAYTVARGKALYRPKACAAVCSDGPYLPEIEFIAEPDAYEVWIYDTVTNKSTLLEKNARMPDWINNAKLIFASARANTWPTPAYHGDDLKVKRLNIYEGDIVNGKLANIVNRTPHVFAMNPMVRTDGQRCYSAFWGEAPRVHGTPANHWVGECYLPDGTGHHTIDGAHGTATYHTGDTLVGLLDPAQRGENTATRKSLRAFAEIRKGWLAVTDYYRGNHQGSLGIIWKFPYSIYGLQAEGFRISRNIPSQDYPSDVLGGAQFTQRVEPITPYGQNQDNPVRRWLNGKTAGKAGYVAPLPASVGKFLFTQCEGSCYEGDLPHQANRAYNGGQPSSHRYVMKALKDVVRDPRTDAEPVACFETEEFNCFDARWRATYKEFYGQELPAGQDAKPVTGDRMTFRIAAPRVGEIFKLTFKGTQYKSYMDCALQGCADPGWESSMVALVVSRVDPWTTLPTRREHFKTTVVGTFPIPKVGRMEFSLDCKVMGTMYQFSAIDKDGKTVAKDNSLHPTVCGEVVTCDGCHDGHSYERLAELMKIAPTVQQRFEKALFNPVVQSLSPGG
jgi:hypothetical protein